MSSKTIIKTINHYKKSIEASEADEKRLLHCIGVLYKLPVQVTHLQETGIGRIVNGLCRDGELEEVRVAAKALVNKWKKLVANESSAESAGENPPKHEEEKQQKDSDRIRKERHERSASSHHSSHHKSHHQRHHHHHHEEENKAKNGSDAVKVSNSGSSKHKQNGDESRLSSGNSKEKNHSEETTHRKSKEHSSSHHHHHHHKSSKSNDKSKDSSKKRSREKNSNDKSEGETKKRKETTREKSEEVDMEIDCSAGTSFADALAMMDAPPSTSKPKSLPKKDEVPIITHKPASSSSAEPSTSKSVKLSDPKSNRKSHSDRSEKPKRPDQLKLLASSTKLEPLLDPEVIKNDILSTPVVISTSYTPLPNFMNPSNSAQISAAISKNKRQFPLPVFDAFEIPSHSRARTKVYSGNKTSQAVSSLYEMCIRLLQKNIDALEYTGGVPYDILKPVLEKCTPQQLHNFEYYNPYLTEDTDELWQTMCQRHFRGKKRAEFETWREMYIRCQTEDQERLSLLAESIKQSQKTSIPVKQTKLAYVDGKDKVPRMGRRGGGGRGGGNEISLNASLTNRSTVSGAKLGHLTAGRDVAAKRAPLMLKTLQFMKRKR